MRRRHSFATVLVGKYSLRREGIAKILRSANVRILASGSSADGLLTRKDLSCQLLFLIVHTGDDFAASVKQMELFKKRYPDARIAVLADHYQQSELDSALRAGATGYFVDVMSCDTFVKSIELVMMGEAVLPPAFLSCTAEADAAVADQADSCIDATINAPEDQTAQQLSPRERSILRCLIGGDSNKCIARKINITEATVKVHIKAILRKIRVQNRTQAAIWGINSGALAQPTGNRPLQLNYDMSDPAAYVARETTNGKHIQGPVPLGAIDEAQLDFGGTEGRIGKDPSPGNDGTIRFRK